MYYLMHMLREQQGLLEPMTSMPAISRLCGSEHRHPGSMTWALHMAAWHQGKSGSTAQVQQPRAKLQPRHQDAVDTIADVFRLEGGSQLQVLGNSGQQACPCCRFCWCMAKFLWNFNCAVCIQQTSRVFKPAAGTVRVLMLAATRKAFRAPSWQSVPTDRS